MNGQELTLLNNSINLIDAPDIPGLHFRGFRGGSDYPHMVAVIHASEAADQNKRADTVEDVARNYENLINCDPYQDMLFAEIDGEVIAYSRVWWGQEPKGDRLYFCFGFLRPEWRRQGIGRAMLRYNQQRLREIAAGHPRDGARFFELEIADTQTGLHALLRSEGFQPAAYFAEMVRPNLEDIPEAPMPEGLEVRPVKPEHYRAIWEADAEAMLDHWGYETLTDPNGYQAWLNHPIIFQPELWKIAWDGEEVAGQVKSFINYKENEAHGRKRGYTEAISVRRPWRRRGLARSLLVQSLHEVKQRGMEEAALGVHTDNPNGAFKLYESVGFRTERGFTAYRKPMDEQPI